MRCHAVGSGTPMSSTQLATPNFYSQSRDAMICVYDESGNVIATHEYAGDFKEW